MHPLQGAPRTTTIVLKVSIAGAAGTSVDIAVDISKAPGATGVGAVGGDHPQVLRSHHPAITTTTAEPRFCVPALELVVRRQCDRRIPHRFVVLCGRSDNCEVSVRVPPVETLDAFIDGGTGEIRRVQELEDRRFAGFARSEMQQRRPLRSTGEDHLIDPETSQLRSEVAAPGAPHESGGSAIGDLQGGVPVEEGPQAGHDPGTAQQTEVHDEWRRGGVGIVDANSGEQLGRPGDTTESVLEILASHRLESDPVIGQIHVVPIHHHGCWREQRGRLQHDHPFNR